MRSLWPSLLFTLILGCNLARADAPATEFFVIETAKLAELAPTDDRLDSLSTQQLGAASLASGRYGGGMTMVCETATFRIDARFDNWLDFSAAPPASVGYNISASTQRKSWDLFSVQGKATKLGKQYVTANWREQRLTVILRYLDLRE